MGTVYNMTVNDAVLILTNEREFYEAAIRIFSQYRDGEKHWDQVVSAIRFNAHDHFNMACRSMEFQQKLIEELHEYYKEEVYGNVNDTAQERECLFQVGDKIQRISGATFSTGAKVAEVSEIEWSTKYGYKLFIKKGGWIGEEDVTDAGNDNPNILQETTTMSDKLIETRTFINGMDASKMDDDAIFRAIHDAEKMADKMGDIDNKPQTLINKIADLRKDIAALVNFVDARNNLNNV